MKVMKTYIKYLALFKQQTNNYLLYYKYKPSKGAIIYSSNARATEIYKKL